MLITFWSPLANVGTTSAAMAIASAVAMNKEHSTKSILLHSAPNISTIEQTFNLDGKAVDREKGLLTVSRLAKMSLLRPETLQDYSDAVVKERLDILSVTTSGNTVAIEWDTILKAALFNYTYTFVDVSNDDWEQQKHFLEKADLIVVCIPQDLFMIKQMIEQDLPGIVKRRKHAFLMTQYDSGSNLSAKTINRMKEFKGKRVLKLPYNSKFKDAINYKKGQDFFFRTLIREEKDNGKKEFRKDLQAITKYLHQQRFAVADDENIELSNL